MEETEHIVYRYMVNGEPIYIGKTNSNLYNRIYCHSREDKFRKYLSEANIEYLILQNATETDIMEKLLINKYKPILNVIDNHDGLCGIEFCEPGEWNSYDKYISMRNYDLEFLPTSKTKGRIISEKNKERKLKKEEAKRRKLERTRTIFCGIYVAAMNGDESFEMEIGDDTDILYAFINFPSYEIHTYERKDKAGRKIGNVFCYHTYDSFSINYQPDDNILVFTWDNEDRVFNMSIIDCFKYLMENGDNYIETSFDVYRQYKSWLKSLDED